MAATRLCCCLLTVMMMMTMMSLTMVPVCQGQSMDNSKVAFNVKTWLQLMQEKIHQLKRAVDDQKRGCNGFPCMYTHLGAKAGRQAYMETLLSKLARCAHDPSCSPGKRRRRSAPAEAVLALLTQHQRKETS